MLKGNYKRILKFLFFYLKINCGSLRDLQIYAAETNSSSLTMQKEKPGYERKKRRAKGSDRQCMAVELKMKWCEIFIYESFETYKTFSRCILIGKSTFKIINLGGYVLRIGFLILIN